VAQACLDWGFGAQIGPATLVASELVTNALVHAGTGPVVSVARYGPRLRVAVRDGNGRRPQPQDVDLDHHSGRGMLLVAAVSHAWGVLPTLGGGKVVWAVLDDQPV
jgi:anti-sigma regulatory factor (Ser/Thr protein kinase)